MADYTELKARIAHLKSAHFAVEGSEGYVGYTSLSEPEKALCDVLVAIVEALEEQASHHHIYVDHTRNAMGTARRHERHTSPPAVATIQDDHGSPYDMLYSPDKP